MVFPLPPRDAVDRDMCFELQRFISYSELPLYANVSGLRLAQAGFFYTGLGVTVKCFCCRKNYSYWRTDDGTLFRTGNFMHETDCDFMLGTDTSNVPMHENMSQ
ncbi:hypothetical protein DPMN_055664 [Dreissena polymorpha]|uniref:Uncharacterized protein n=1 Tax=Dreissena polymorpha TaxID=45954 RepID=A0A9D4HSS7_DREPO|nr:hypothetical protein DPMN_055664 [Dreissena polymorpha]